MPKPSQLPQDSSPVSADYMIGNQASGPTTQRFALSALASYFWTLANIPAGQTSPITRDNEMQRAFFVSGGIITGDAYGSTRNASMSALVCYINGRRISIAAVTARTYSASLDTYVDVLDNGDGTGTLVYTTVSTGGTAPSLATNSIRLAKVVVGATSIAAATSIVQNPNSDGIGNVFRNLGPASTEKTLIPYKFLMGRAAALNTSLTVVAVQFDTKIYDTGNNCDVSTNKGRFTAPVAGFYQFYFSGLASVTVGDHIYAGFMKNGAEAYRAIECNAQSTVNNTYSGMSVIQLNAGDYVELYYITNVARSFLVGTTPPLYLWFGGHIISSN